MSNAIDCKRAVYAIIEKIVRETEDVDTLLLGKRDKKRKYKEEINGTKPGERIIAKISKGKRKPVATRKWHV